MHQPKDELPAEDHSYDETFKQESDREAGHNVDAGFEGSLHYQNFLTKWTMT